MSRSSQPAEQSAPRRPETWLSLRPEQNSAITATYNYWQSGLHPAEFLWNAKPRFGKTIAAYEFAKKIKAARILIITNRPAVSDSWQQDFSKIFSDTEYQFFTSRSKQIKQQTSLALPFVFFISLQDIKGKSAADFKSKNKWIYELKTKWDLLIIDECHDGVKTDKSQIVFSKIPTAFTLYLSGTPFRALSDQDFRKDQIFNWSYLDEQKLSAAPGPRLTIRAADLPELLNNYSLPPDIFELQSGQFMYPEHINQLLDVLAQIYQTSTLDLSHTFWLLSGVKECQHLQNILNSHPFFQDFQVVVAAGKTEQYTSGKKILDVVRSAIQNYPRTITLSCGQLATGVTVPEWAAIFMLQNSSDIEKISVAAYVQTMFRGSSAAPGKKIWSVFDFNPTRIYHVMNNYAMNLCDNSLELWDYVDTYIYKNGSWQHDSADSLEKLSKHSIAREIVNGKFITSDKLLNFDHIFELSKDDLALINRLDYKHSSKRSHHGRPIITRQEISNLAALEKVLPDGLDYYDSKQISDIKLQKISAELTYLRESARSSSHKKYLDIKSRYRDKMRSITCSFPLLIFIYASNSTTLEKLIADIPDEILLRVANLTSQELARLRQLGCFNERNFNIAIQEFVRRRESHQTFYLQPTFASIFDYIPSCGGQVFTPTVVVNKMLDILETQNPAIFKNPSYNFFDPAPKSGNLLAGVVHRLFQNQRTSFSSDEECLQNIMSQQIYAAAADDFAENILRKNLPKLSNIIKPNANMIKEGINMKFNVIISNPPYENGRRQVYADFYKLAVDLNPDLLCMVFPQGWQKPYNHNGLGQINKPKYKRDPHIVFIDNYDEKSANKLFPDVGTGGVNIVLRDQNYNNSGAIKKLIAGRPAGTMKLPITKTELEKPSELISLIDLLATYPKMDALGSARKPYGFYSDPLRNPKRYHLVLRDDKVNESDVRLFGLLANTARGFKYISRDSLPAVTRCIDSYKIFVPKAWGNMAENIGLGGSFANICVARPGDVCSETFIEFGPFKNRTEATKIAKYFMTKFFRALLFLAKDSQNTARDKYRYIPVPDVTDKIWRRSIAEIDDYLFSEYQFPPATRQFIQANIQTRDESNIEIL